MFGVDCSVVLWLVAAWLIWAVQKIASYYFDFKYKNKKRVLPPITNPILLEPVHKLAVMIRQRTLRSEDLVQACIDRINAINLLINAVVDTRFEQALEEARAIDDLLDSGAAPLENNQPLLGIPFSIKDSFHVSGLRCVLGLPCRRDCQPSTDDADVVAILKNAGAISLCVTNVCELCVYWDSSNTVYGTTNNPYDTTRIPGGSSGGEGALQAAAGVPISVGSDIGGSIRLPSAFCGLFGHKPTPGVVSNHGQEPKHKSDWEVMLGTGPMCRYASDLQPLLRIMAGSNVDLLQLNEQVDLTSLRLFYLNEYGGNIICSPVQDDIAKALSKALKHLTDAFGLEPVLAKSNLHGFRHAIPIWFSMMMGITEDAYNMPELLTDFKGPFCVWKELLLSLFGRSEHTNAALRFTVLAKFWPKMNSEKHKHYLSLRNLLKETIEELLADDGILILPTQPTTAPYHGQTHLLDTNTVYTAVFNTLGVPVTSIPMGLSSDGLPIGIQVVAGPFNDRMCLAVARELEKAFGGWVSPSVIV